MRPQSPSAEDLAQALARSQHPLIVTGAGMSVASGLAAYRRGPDAVWNRFITEWGTVEMLYERPLEWWREFWLKAHTPEELVRARPNPGHRAVARLLELKPEALLVTQNIDRLHALAGADPDRLIEIHGRAGLYRCTSGSCPGFAELLEDLDLGLVERGEIPRCERCGDLLRPLVLLFDEIYISHPFFQARRAFKALEQADLFVFAGTSFSVGFTSSAVSELAGRRVPVYNLNIEDSTHFPTLQGPTEKTLPAVVEALEAQRRRP